MCGKVWVLMSGKYDIFVENSNFFKTIIYYNICLVDIIAIMRSTYICAYIVWNCENKKKAPSGALLY